MDPIIKLSSPSPREFWEVPVLLDEEHLLALAKPARLLTSPDRANPARPSLMELLHRDIARGAAWARERQIGYLNNVHRLDAEASGVLLLARNKPALVALANQFGSEEPVRTLIALVTGAPAQASFEVDLRIGSHPTEPGLMRIERKRGMRAVTRFEVLERFKGCTLLKVQSLTGRRGQVSVHLQYLGLPLVGDAIYGGKPLLLSKIKSSYRLKPGRVERPLLDRATLHASELVVKHPLTGEPVRIEAPWPKDLKVAVKYLRLYAAAPGTVPTTPFALPAGAEAEESEGEE